MICNICPHLCDIKNGEHGKCLVRHNNGERIYDKYYGRCSTIALDSIEKRPFFHFLPGSKFLSVGLLGCNFSCPMCQNFAISQSTDHECKYLSPDELCVLARDRQARGIVFTYSEPTIHYEYVQEVALKTTVAIKSNGFMMPHVLSGLSKSISAWNIDLKGDSYSYINTCKGYLSPVMSNIEYIFGKSHLELSYLVLPSMIDNVEFHTYIRDWIADISDDIPVHVLYCYPVHKMEQHYNKDSLLKVYDILSEKLNYVYISNVYGDHARRNTLCKKCGSLMIERNPAGKVHKSECCGKNIKGIFS